MKKLKNNGPTDFEFPKLSGYVRDLRPVKAADLQ